METRNIIRKNLPQINSNIEKKNSIFSSDKLISKKNPIFTFESLKKFSKKAEMFVEIVENIQKDIFSNMNESSANSNNTIIKYKNQKKKFNSKNNSLNNDDSSLEGCSTENSNGEIEKTKPKNLYEVHVEYNNITLEVNQFNDIYKENDMDSSYFQNNKENEYLNDIFENLINEENNNKYKINSNYFNFQNDINDKMRKVLIDWLIEIHYKLKFKEETFYTTIYIIDAYLSQKRIERKNLQLLGITAIFIASKLYEINSGNIEDYSNITAKTYNKEEIINMESDISKTLNFNFLIPTPILFYEILTKKMNLENDSYEYKFGEFLIQSYIMDSESFKYNYSIISYSSLYLISKIFKLNYYNNCKNNNNKLLIGNIYIKSLNIIKECSKSICIAIYKVFNTNLKSAIRKYSCINLKNDVDKIISLRKNLKA